MVTLGSLCAAPLVFRETRMGVLVALGSDDGFLPRDLELLSSYAAQAAIALTNATLYETQQRLAIQDPLTGLYNHRHFHEVLGSELERCRRHGGELGLVLFDLDAFKQINDTEGHAAGDEVLSRRRAVAGEHLPTLRHRPSGSAATSSHCSCPTPESGRPASRPRAPRRRSRPLGDEREASPTGSPPGRHAGPTKDAMLASADADLYEMKRLAASDAGERDPRGRRLARHERLASASRIALKLAPLHEEDEIARTAIDELDESFGLHLVAIHVARRGLGR